MNAATALLEVSGLEMHFKTAAGVSKVINGVDLKIGEGQVHGLVGESGSGKSVTARAVLGILPPRAVAHQGGVVSYRGRNLMDLTERQMREEIRGKQVSMIFQDPMTALNPVMRIGNQLVLPIRKHRGLSKRRAKEAALEMLKQVGLPDPEQKLRAYPHELSGGQRQRVMIAIALACDPKLLIADEPTTALDVTVQAQIMDLLGSLRREHRLAVLLVSHDLGLIAERCDEVSVMYAGEVVERGGAAQVLAHRRHPYTRLLEGARPRLVDAPHTTLKTIPGHPPNPLDRPEGCAFRARCPRAIDRCATERPTLMELPGSTAAACHHPWPADSPSTKLAPTLAHREEL